jgi:cardiolipin synthase
MEWFWSVEHWGTWSLWAAIAAMVHFGVQGGLALRVVMQRRSTGETLAWMLILFALPLIGIGAYLMLGELRLGRRREARFLRLFPPVAEWLGRLRERPTSRWNAPSEEARALATMCERTLGVPTLSGNRVELIGDWQEAFARLLADIDAAERTIHLEFYIWHRGGEADRVVEALLRARQRGVACRVLVDSLGSRGFLRGDAAARLRSAGVEVLGALPGGLLRMPFVRFDLRLHRKIAVIDGRAAYTGSLNLVDPRYFKKDAGVGPWVDAMVRIEGPAVEALAVTFLADWFVESDADLEKLRSVGDASEQPVKGDCPVQVLPSGPGVAPRAIEQILITAVYSAREELVLTTPYFVPSEALQMALIAAARRGVKVIVVVPARVDSRLVRYASEAFVEELLEAGVKIAKFGEGLLHTKSVTVDGTHALFGSVNLDPRSFRLNFEITLGLYNRDFASQLRVLQQRYIDNSELRDLEAYKRRSAMRRAGENFARILGPVL